MFVQCTYLWMLQNTYHVLQLFASRPSATLFLLSPPARQPHACVTLQAKWSLFLFPQPNPSLYVSCSAESVTEYRYMVPGKLFENVPADDIFPRNMCESTVNTTLCCCPAILGARPFSASFCGYRVVFPSFWFYDPASLCVCVCSSH